MTERGTIAEVMAFLTERHPETMEIALWLRGVILDAEPDLTERVYRGWDGIGFRHPEGGYVCAIYPQADEVRLLFEHGRRLEDPDGLLEGDGRQTRWMRVRDADAALAAAIARCLGDAIAERLTR